MMPASMVLSCEHAGNKIPRRFQKLYLGQKAILKSHRGFDIGALGVTKILAKALHLPFYKSEISRLLIDHNRSLTNKALYSEFSASLKQTEKTFILNNYYRPHHLKVQNNVQRILARKTRANRG